MDRVSRIVLAAMLIVGVIAGTAILSNMSWMPVIYPTMVTYPEASTRVAIEQADVTAYPWDFESYRTYTSIPFLLEKGETVTVEFEATQVPTISLGGEGVIFTVGRSGLWRYGEVAYSYVFYGVLDSSGMSAPKEFIVPETAYYVVHIVNHYRPLPLGAHDLKLSFKLTARSTTIVGGPDSVSPPIAPYGKAQTLMMLWLLLGVGMLVGAACTLLIRPRQVAAQPPPLQAARIEPRLQMKFCRECGAKIPSESKFCENCGAKFT